MTDEVLKWIQKEKLIERGDVVIAGVSGGADSVCLLRLLLEIREKIEFGLSVVHVEHGIRGGESVSDARFVEDLCQDLGVYCCVFHPDVVSYAAKHRMGMEEAARILRYDCYMEEVRRIRHGFYMDKYDTEYLTDVCEEQMMGQEADCTGQMAGKNTGADSAENIPMVRVALAHHADDNAETVLFQMIRGSGLHGGCGMRASRPFTEGAVIIRPLLLKTRLEIERYLSEKRQSYRTDSTNLDTGYSRNRIRREVIPQLTKINRQAAAHLNQNALFMQEVCDYLDDQVLKAEASAVRWEGTSCLIDEKELFSYPAFLQKEVLLSVLGRAAKSRKDLGRVHVDLVLGLFSHQVGRRIELPYGILAERGYEGLRVIKRMEAERTDSECYVITQEELVRMECGEALKVRITDGELRLRILDFDGEMEEIEKKKYTKWVNYDIIKGGMQFRRRKSGDYLQIDKNGHKKKLKNYLIEEKIPQGERDKLWLAAEESHIIWVIGRRISAGYKIEKDTRKILEIQITGGSYHED